MSSKITIKRSTTAIPPAGLSFGEMAFVQGTGLTANQLYVGISGGSPVWVGAQIGTTGSWTDNSAKTSLATQYAIDQRILSQISGGSPITTVSDNTNTTRYLVLSTSAAAGVTLFVDDATGALSYNPSTGNMRIAGDVEINGGDITTGSSVATIFDGTATSLSIGSAATGITMGATTGTFGIRNPSLTVGSSGVTGTIFADDANLVLTTKNYTGAMADPGDSSAKIIINDNIGAGFVNIEGGDLRLGNKTLSASVSGVDIVFEGTTDNTNELKLTAGDPGADYTVTLPHLTDTLVGKATSDTFTNKTYDTAGTGNVFRIAGVTLSAVTGTGAVVLATSPAITTSLTSPSASFTLLATPTTVNFAGAATALNMGVVGGTATFAGALTVSGDLTVNGTTTTINSTTLSVDDKNIEMAAIGVPDDATANGGGIIIKGATDKSILWDSANGNLTSNQDWNLPTGKVFKINNVSVLSSSALGSGITGSSLTQVGTITSGTWSGSFGAVSGANLTVLTAGGLTGTIPSGVLGNSNVFIGTTSVALNRTSASISLTGVNIDGSAGSATTAGTATNANNIAVVSDTSDTTCFVTFVTDTTGNLPAKVNSTLTYNAVSGELSATLIDGGSF
jgi:hypothetical protein